MQLHLLKFCLGWGGLKIVQKKVGVQEGFGLVFLNRKSVKAVEMYSMRVCGYPTFILFSCYNLECETEMCWCEILTNERTLLGAISVYLPQLYEIDFLKLLI